MCINYFHHLLMEYKLVFAELVIIIHHIQSLLRWIFFNINILILMKYKRTEL